VSYVRISYKKGAQAHLPVATNNLAQGALMHLHPATLKARILYLKAA